MPALNSGSSQEIPRETGCFGVGWIGDAEKLLGRICFPGHWLNDTEAEEGWEDRGGEDYLYTVQLTLFLVLHGVIVYI